MFGISVMKDFMRCTTNNIFNKHTSMLVMTGSVYLLYLEIF